MYLFRSGGLIASDLIWQTLVLTHSKPVLATVGSSSLENLVKFLEQTLCQSFLCTIDDKVYATEVVYGLHDIIHTDTLSFNTYGVGLEDVTGLVMSKTTSFYMIGVIGKVNLRTMIDSTFYLHLLLLTKNLQQWRYLFGSALF